MPAFTKRFTALAVAGLLLLPACAEDDEIRDNDPPGSTIAEEMSPEGDVLVPTTEGPETIPATTAAG